MKQLVIMIGVCCSGKTNYIKTGRLAGFQYVSEKAFRKGMTLEHIEPDRNHALLYASMAISIRALMIQEFPIVIDDRNLKFESLIILRKYAVEHGYNILGLLMDTPIDVCRERLKKISDKEDDIQMLLKDFERLEDMKSVLFSTHHGKDLFDDLKVIEYGGKKDEIL